MIKWINNPIELKEFLEDVKFLNYKFSPNLNTYNGLSITIMMIFTAPDTQDRKTKITVMLDRSIMIPISEEQLLHELFEGVVDCLRHEASEIFRYKGKALFNEHLTSDQRDKIMNRLMSYEGN